MYVCGHWCWTIDRLFRGELLFLGRSKASFSRPRHNSRGSGAQWMFELALNWRLRQFRIPRPCRAAQGSFAESRDWKQELAKEEKVSVTGVVHGKMSTAVPANASIPQGLLVGLWMAVCYSSFAAGTQSCWDSLVMHTPEIHLVSKRWFLWIYS